MRKKVQKLVITGCLGIAATLGGFTGCSSPDRSSGQHMDDMMTSRRVSSALNDSPIYKFNDVDVKTYNGVVQLSGWAISKEQKTKATDIAKHVRGVREVINNISLKTEAGLLDPRTGQPTAQGSTGSNVQVEQNRQQSTTERQQQEQQDLQQRQLEQQRQEQLRREQVTP